MSLVVGSDPIELGDDFGCNNPKIVNDVDVPRRKRAFKSLRRNLVEKFKRVGDEGCDSGTPLLKRVVKGVKKNYKD